ncbi:hypothetical protein BACOVA_04672 [Bacteroides ovatus ATCC 8483]|uniref:Uncharacterized protein n=1 Tax=Bacteroides ovatus (strain ATCC 8483 / DSM 1896 / JCM 5824 / BCRC 10623 / CCUG 4943 / NCTC 11153) TaxID=411476 RepID=A0AAN3A2C1_BACO1|nr:hypothetical protein BACOVA_04672 [Bacteroides ovatus ATCC 8483]
MPCFCFARNIGCFAKLSIKRENTTQYQWNKVTHPSLGKRRTFFPYFYKRRA